MTRAKASKQTQSDCVVLLINHQPLYLEALAHALRSVPNITVLSRLALEGLEEFSGNDPHVVVIDPCDGTALSTEFISSVKKRWPFARLMVLTDCNEPEVIVAALAYGAHSFILKSEPANTIRAAVELLCGGAAAFSLPAAAVMAAKVAPSLADPSLPAAGTRGLTPREIEILHLVARGFRDADIAQLTNISPRTVERHITNVLNKLNCRSRSQAVAQVIGTAPPLALASKRRKTLLNPASAGGGGALR